MVYDCGGKVEKMKILIIPILKSASSSLAYVLKKLHNLKHEEIAKKHLMPTKNNLNDYKNQKKVVLLRNPEKCRAASQRAVDSLITPEEFGKEDGFLKYPYEEFYDGWINNIDNKTLLIFYKDLIENPKRTINKIEEFYGLNRSKKVKLPKMNYSRSGAMNLQRKIFIQFRKIKLLRNMRNNYFPEELKRLTAV